MLDLAKVEAGKIDLNPEEFAPAEAIAEVCAIIQAVAGKKQVDITWSIGAGLDLVCLDQQKFKQICYNLLANAVKFTDSGGKVELAAWAYADDWVRLQVTDTGIGIKQKDMQRLFREFEQLETGTARRFEGTGLGLALTKKIVEIQGGSITAQSEYGRGSVFSVDLPRHFNKVLGNE